MAEKDDEKALREVQAYMRDAEIIALGGNPHYPLNAKGAKAANKIALRAAMWANQPETRNTGIDRAIDYYLNGGTMWCAGNSIEVNTTSHAHILLAADALNLRAGIEHSPELRRLATATIRMWTAAAGPIEDGRAACTYREGGKLIRLTAGARGQDLRGDPDGPGKRLEKFPTNSCADKVMQGLLTGEWRKAGRRFDVAVIVLRRLVEERKIGAQELLGDDYSPLTKRFGYHVMSDAWGHYSWFDNLDGPGFSPPLYGAGRVNGETVLAWEPVEAVEKALELRA